jgi:hypothetical protein
MPATRPSLPTYRLIGAYRADVAMPTAHSHVIAIGTVDRAEDGPVPTKAWTAKDLEEFGQDVAFVVDRAGSSMPARLEAAPCPECGETVLRVSPAYLEARLPECRVE